MKPSLRADSRDAKNPMRRQGVTLQDIANRTGVSKVTVSYVLNGRETGVRISDSTRQRVMAVARDLGYQPNAVARALARRCTDTITLVMQFPSVFAGGSSFILEMMHGVLDAANALGYDLLLHTKNVPDAAQEVQALTDGRADGILILRNLGDPLTKELQARNFPWVSLFSRSEEPGAHFVDCDNVTGGRIATEYLLSLGHERIGFIGGSAASSAVRDRYRGFTDALTAHGLTPNPAWNAEIGYARADFSPLEKMLRGTDAPTALFLWSDDVAVEAISYLRDKMGMRVPEDVSLVGFDGSETLGERSVPRLTTIRQPIYAIAERALQLLVARIRDAVVTETQILLPPELLIRESCAPPQSSSVSLTHEKLKGRTQ